MPRRTIAAAGRRIVVVSNRVPSPDQSAGAGGLAVALGAALAQHGGVWFGWSGEITEAGTTAPTMAKAGRITYATVDLTQSDHDGYYAGYANRVLWPLFHFRPALVDFSRPSLDAYLRVNAAFARQLAPLLEPSDLVWVQDYHLIPLAAELREQGARQPIGFFLHTPFPPASLLRVLPNHRQLIDQLCAYDVIGFQTDSDADAFRDYVVREAGGVATSGRRLVVHGREIVVDVFPIGIDVETVKKGAAAAASTRQTARLAESLGPRRLMIGVDRLDYSKGLVRRFDAFSRLLTSYPEFCDKVTLLQVAPPSRSDVPEYMEIRRSLEEAAGRINGAYSEPDWSPIRYLNRSFTSRALYGFFRASKVGLVTPFRDGMNLVAKEYVASQDGDDAGVLILSCFAGAAHELTSALIVNPYDLDGMAEAMATALRMPAGERRDRWSDMMRILQRNDIGAWREAFIGRLAELAAPPS